MYKLRLSEIIKLVTKRNFNAYPEANLGIMIPALEDGGYIIDDTNGDDKEYYIDKENDIEDISGGSIFRKYRISTRVIKNGIDYTDKPITELKHMFHCSELCIYSDKYKTTYLKVFLRR